MIIGTARLGAVVISASIFASLAFGHAHAHESQTSGQQDAKPDVHSRLEGKLPNGLSYIVERSFPGSGRVSVQLAVRVGYDDELPSESEFSHLVEHSVVSGTEGFPFSLSQVFAEGGVRPGAGYNASTGFEGTTYSFSFKRDALAPSLVSRVLGEIAGKALLTDSIISHEITLVRAEAAGAGNGADDIVGMQARYDAIYRRTGRPNTKLADAVDFDAVREFYKKWYSPDRMMVVVVGDVDPEEWERRIAENFSDLKSRPTPADRGRVYAIDLATNKQPITFRSDRSAPITRIYKTTSEDMLSTRTKIKYDIMGRMVVFMNDRLPHDVGLKAGYFCELLLAAKNRNCGVYVESSVERQGGVERSININSQFLRYIASSGYNDIDFDRAKGAARQIYYSTTDRDIDNVASEYAANFLNQYSERPKYLKEKREILASVTNEEMKEFYSSMFEGNSRRKTIVDLPKDFDVKLIYDDRQKYKKEKYEVRSPDPIVKNITNILESVRAQSNGNIPKNKEGKFILSNGIELTIIPSGSYDSKSGVSVLFESSNSYLRLSGMVSGEVSLHICPENISDSDFQSYKDYNGVSSRLKFGPDYGVLTSLSRSDRPEAAFEIARAALFGDIPTVKIVGGGVSKIGDGPGRRFLSRNLGAADSSIGYGEAIANFIRSARPKAIVVYGAEDQSKIASLANLYLGSIPISEKLDGSARPRVRYSYAGDIIDLRKGSEDRAPGDSTTFKFIYETNVDYSLKSRAIVEVFNQLGTIVGDRLLRGKGGAYFQSVGINPEIGSIGKSGVNLALMITYVSTNDRSHFMKGIVKEIVSELHSGSLSAEDLLQAKMMAIESIDGSGESSEGRHWEEIFDTVMGQSDAVVGKDDISKVSRQDIENFAADFFSRSEMTTIVGR